MHKMTTLPPRKEISQWDGVVVDGRTLRLGCATQDENLIWLQDRVKEILKEFRQREQGRRISKGQRVKNRPWDESESPGRYGSGSAEVIRSDSTHARLEWTDFLLEEERVAIVELEVIG